MSGERAALTQIAFHRERMEGDLCAAVVARARRRYLMVR
jgi:hypothetical protein